MKFIKPYQEYLINLFLKNLIIVTLIFASLSFILNILEEVKFFKEFQLGFYYPIIFTALNLPSILFEIFPFIILISTQMFFMHLYNRDEINIFKNYGIKNTDIIVNASPIGTYPNILEAPNIPYKYLNSKHLLFDLIYNPKETEFLKRGKLYGSKTSNGLKMLKYQADKSWELWSTWLK